MFNEGDDDIENTTGAVRYPCMPSLVSLQQMRNRLNLAFLGRKLMKWTTIGTGKEIRRLSAEISELYKSFAEDIRNAYILLARCRYFFPNLNDMVLEDVQPHASVYVTSTMKTITGVKVGHYSTIEVPPGPYPYLGISKGGQKIKEAKEAWLDLLRRMILMVELRKSFELVEAAYKNATMKQKVLEKVVVPRSQASIVYINNELEELERENFFRLKKILTIRRKMTRKCEEPVKTHINTEEAKETSSIHYEEIIEKCFICGALLRTEEDLSLKAVEEITADENLLETFKSHIDNIVSITKSIEERGIMTPSVEHFWKTAEELKEKLEHKPEDEEVKIPPDVPTNKLCATCLKRFKKQNVSRRQPPLPPNEDKKTEPEPDAEPKSDPDPEPELDPDQDPEPKVEQTLEPEQKSEPEQNSEPGLDIGPEPDSELAQYKENVQSPESSTPSTAPVSKSPSKAGTELGAFKTEVKKIIKIIRVKNEDGTITEERKVVKIKKIMRTPVQANDIPSNQNEEGKIMHQSSDISSKSNHFSGSKTVGMVTLDDSEISSISFDDDDLIRKFRSNITERLNSNTDLRLQSFIPRASTFLSESDCDEEDVKIIDVDGNELINLSMRLKEIFASNSDMEKILQSFEPQSNKDASTSNWNTNQIVCSPHTTESGQSLFSLSNSKDEEKIKNILKSTSEPNLVKSKKKKQNVNNSVSFEKEKTKHDKKI